MTNLKHLFKKLRTSAYFLLVFTATSCLEEIEVDIEQTEPQLVVEGFVNSLGQIRVQLTSTEDFTQVAASPIGGANAQIIEIDGPTMELLEFGPGLYSNATAEVIPEVGKSYQLRIVLPNGEEYLSSIETILEPIEITGDNVELKTTTVEIEGTTGRTFYSHEVSVTVSNTPEDHYYYLSNQAWEQVQVWYPPFECFGAPWPGPDICWLFRDPIIENKVTIGSNLEIGADNYSILAEEIPFSGPRSFIAFVTVNSISAENHAFWQRINVQLTRENGIFDRPFAPIVGNIRGVNTNKIALGYFQAYGTTRQTVCFDRFDVPVAFAYPLAPCDFSCVEYWGFDRATDFDLQQFFCQ